MTPELTAKIGEIETQRNMFATRCAELAGKLAAANAELAQARTEREQSETALKAAQDTIASQETAARHKAE